MEKITSFQITSLTLSGFRCFVEPVTFQFGQMNLITGHNGLGKSSLADAIAFAVTGVPFFGGTGLDRLYYDQGEKELTVDLSLTDGAGTRHRLTRHRKNNTMSITWGGMAIRQSDLTELFGERDIFLSMFNPLYFIERLGEQGRDLLERYLPAISHEAVLEQLDDRSRGLLEGVEMRSPQGYLTKLREDIREAESSVTYLQGQRDVLEEQEKTRADALLAAQSKLETASARAAELEGQRYAGLDLGALGDQLADLYARHGELTCEIAAPDTVALDAQIQTVTRALEQCRAATYKSKYQAAIADAAVKVRTAQQEYAAARRTLNGLQPGVQCPTCLQRVTMENIGAVRAEWQTHIHEIVERGKELSAQLEELRTLDGKAKAVFEQFQTEDVAKGEAALAECVNRRKEIVEASAKAGEELPALTGQIQNLEYTKERGALTDEAWAELTALTAALPNLAAEVERLTKGDDSSAEEKGSIIVAFKTKIRNLKLKVTAASLYIDRKMELQFADFKLNRVAISLYELVKTTGELKSVFKFTYEGRVYQELSLSEKIRAGLEISVLIQRLVGRCCPVFVDNGESVAAIDNVRPTGQLFMARVVKGAPLNVSVVGRAATAQSTPEAA